MEYENTNPDYFKIVFPWSRLLLSSFLGLMTARAEGGAGEQGGQGKGDKGDKLLLPIAFLTNAQ